jgi:hypothetical protein
MWARVFAAVDSAPSPDAIVAHLNASGHAAQARADTDAHGWFHLELSTAAGALTLDRYGANEGIRDDLNAWAAWLEIHAGAHADRLMQHMIGSQQIITLRCLQDVDDELRRVLHDLMRLLATETSGIYQVDGEGFFDAAGALLVAEEAHARATGTLTDGEQAAKPGTGVCLEKALASAENRDMDAIQDLPPDMRTDTDAVLAHLTSGQPLPDAIARRIRERSDQVRDQIYRAHGLLDIGVSAIRELRDDA